MWTDIFQNEIFLACLLTAIVTNGVKIFLTYKSTGKLDLTLFWKTGGMPSSHSALVSALTTAVYFIEGFDTVFFVSFVFSMVVIWDAFGVRKQTGEQAQIINKIIYDLKLEKRLKVKRLRELVGHTTTQVQVGILVGVGIAILTHLMVKCCILY